MPSFNLGGDLGLQASTHRQWPLVAVMEFVLDDLTSGEAGRAVVMPGGSWVIGGGLVITEAFNSGTSDTMVVGDEDDDDRYAAAVDASDAGRTALTVTGHRYTGKQTIDLKWTSDGTAPTQGRGFLYVEYLIDGRGGEVQPAGTIGE